MDEQSSRAYDPTAAMFGGNFASAGATIFDPATFGAQTGTRQPFPNNVIPTNRINRVATNLLKNYLPGASLAEKPNNVFGNPRNTLNDDQGRLTIRRRLPAGPTSSRSFHADAGMSSDLRRSETRLDAAGQGPAHEDWRPTRCAE